MKIKLGLFFIIIYVSSVQAQESNQYSLYMLQKYAHNPAYAGLESSLSITGAYRTQWQELQGSPVSKMIQAHMPLYYVKGAAGIKLEQEILGIEKTLRASVSYNYILENQIGLFSAGIGLGFLQKSLDGSQLRTPGGRYEGGVINHEDGTLFNSTLNGIAPHISLGVYFARDQFETGLSIADFYRPKINFNRGKTSYTIDPRLNWYAEYAWSYAENIEIIPSILLKSDFRRIQTDLSLRATVNQNITGGLSLRGYSANSLDALILLGGLQVNPQLKIFYAFDLSLSAIRDFHAGTHELVLNYNLNKKIGAIEREPIIYNPRY